MKVARNDREQDFILKYVVAIDVYTKAGLHVFTSWVTC